MLLWPVIIKSGHNFAHVPAAHNMCKIVIWLECWNQNEPKTYLTISQLWDFFVKQILGLAAEVLLSV